MVAASSALAPMKPSSHSTGWPSRTSPDLGQIGPTGIDTFATLQTKHLNGMAQLYCGVGLHGEGDALPVGPLGNVAIPSKWWNPVHATIRYVDGRTVELDEPFLNPLGSTMKLVTSAI